MPETNHELERAAAEIAEVRRRIHEEVGKVAVGMAEKIDLLLVALLARGHVLFEGVPGIAKTLLAKSAAQALGCRFQRIQFTPDLLPGDITGTSIFDRNRGAFEFKKGPIFTEILLVDEINRSPAKTQSALLEAMQERQVSMDGQTYPLGNPFLVIATQNPIEQEGVYRLPEAQLDRFFLRVLFAHPTPEEEAAILRMHSRDVPTLAAITNAEQIRRWQGLLQQVAAAPEIYRGITDLAKATREHSDVFLGMSPRASLCVLLAAQSWEFLHGRTYVTHEAVKRVVDPVLNHRILLKPEAELAGRRTEEVIADSMKSVRTVG